MAEGPSHDLGTEGSVLELKKETPKTLQPQTAPSIAARVESSSSKTCKSMAIERLVARSTYQILGWSVRHDGTESTFHLRYASHYNSREYQYPNCRFTLPRWFLVILYFSATPPGKSRQSIAAYTGSTIDEESTALPPYGLTPYASLFSNVTRVFSGYQTFVK